MKGYMCLIVLSALCSVQSFRIFPVVARNSFTVNENDETRSGETALSTSTVDSISSEIPTVLSELSFTSETTTPTEIPTNPTEISTIPIDISTIQAEVYTNPPADSTDSNISFSVQDITTTNNNQISTTTPETTTKNVEDTKNSVEITAKEPVIIKQEANNATSELKSEIEEPANEKSKPETETIVSVSVREPENVSESEVTSKKEVSRTIPKDTTIAQIAADVPKIITNLDEVATDEPDVIITPSIKMKNISGITTTAITPTSSESTTASVTIAAATSDVTSKDDVTSEIQSEIELSSPIPELDISINLLPPKSEYRKFDFDPRYDDWKSVPVTYEEILIPRS